MRLLLLIAWLALLLGCTRVRYEGGALTYWSVMQRRTVDVEKTSGTLRVRYASDTDPAHELLNAALRGGR